MKVMLQAKIEWSDIEAIESALGSAHAFEMEPPQDIIEAVLNHYGIAVTSKLGEPVAKIPLIAVSSATTGPS